MKQRTFLTLLVVTFFALAFLLPPVETVQAGCRLTQGNGPPGTTAVYLVGDGTAEIVCNTTGVTSAYFGKNGACGVDVPYTTCLINAGSATGGRIDSENSYLIVTGGAGAEVRLTVQWLYTYVNPFTSPPSDVPAKSSEYYHFQIPAWYGQVIPLAWNNDPCP